MAWNPLDVKSVLQKLYQYENLRDVPNQQELKIFKTVNDNIKGLFLKIFVMYFVNSLTSNLLQYLSVVCLIFHLKKIKLHKIIFLNYYVNKTLVLLLHKSFFL